MLILASASPRRREMLARVGIAFDVRPADIDETERAGEAPRAYVLRVARAKAQALAAGGDDVVLAADTTVTIDDAILAKAADGAEAAAMLRRLSGRTHDVLTAFAIARGDRLVEEVVTTRVTMVELDEATIADYVACGEWRGKAGAYAVQGIAAAMVVGIAGSITNVVGLPLVEVLAALRGFGIAPSFVAGAPQ